MYYEIEKPHRCQMKKKTNPSTKFSVRKTAGKTKTGRHVFRIKRVYDQPAADDGLRFLVDRLWPRGVKKTALALTGWTREVAPSSSLRKWFGHEPSKWAEFRRRYRAELEANPSAWKPLKEMVEKDNVTLLFATRDREVNHAKVLKEYLDERGA